MRDFIVIITIKNLNYKAVNEGSDESLINLRRELYQCCIFIQLQQIVLVIAARFCFKGVETIL